MNVTRKRNILPFTMVSNSDGIKYVCRLGDMSIEVTDVALLTNGPVLFRDNDGMTTDFDYSIDLDKSSIKITVDPVNPNKLILVADDNFVTMIAEQYLVIRACTGEVSSVVNETDPSIPTDNIEYTFSAEDKSRLKGVLVVCDVSSLGTGDSLIVSVQSNVTSVKDDVILRAPRVIKAKDTLIRSFGELSTLSVIQSSTLSV